MRRRALACLGIFLASCTSSAPEVDAPLSTVDAPLATVDAKPSAVDAKPSAADAKPSAADAKPSAADAKPSAADAKPSAIDAKPSAVDAPPSAIDATIVTGAPHLGAHALAFHRLGGSVAPISTPAMATQASGSLLLVFEGRGDKTLFSLPTDNKGNTPYVQMGAVQKYTHYMDSGTAVYAFASASGGAGHVITAQTTEFDEITLAAVEVVGGQAIQDFKWNEILAPNTTTSLQVTTTGPATLVAVWWGDAPEPDDKTAMPDSGFNVIESVLFSGALVQCAVATREVAAAGTYSVTWTSTPVQGAQMWLFAVQ